MRYIIMYLSIFCLCTSAFSQTTIGFSDMEMYKFTNSISLLSSTDINNDGKDDLYFIDNSKAIIQLLINKGENTAPVKPSPREIIDNINVINYDSRFTVHTIPVTDRIYSLKITDINNDTLPDIVYIGAPGGLHVLFQGEYTTFTPAPVVPINNILPSPDTLYCDTLQKDSPPYIMIFTNKTILLFNWRTDPHFANPIRIPLGEDFLDDVRHISIQDMNNDGLKDILFTRITKKDSLWIRYQTAPNVFGLSRTFDAGSYRRLISQDIDADGIPECVYIQSPSGRIITSHFKSSAQKNHNIVFYPYGSSYSGERCLALGDITNDNKTDILITEPKVSAITSFINTPPFLFGTEQQHPSLNQSNTLYIANLLPRSGNEVLVFSQKENSAGISYYKDNGLSFPKPISLIGKPITVAVADINQDSIPDLIYATLEQKPQKKRSLYIRPGLAQGGFVSQDISIPLEKKIQSNPTNIRIFDINRDTRPDIILFIPYEKAFRILVQNEDHSFYDITQKPDFNRSMIENITSDQIYPCDFDSDSINEFIITKSNFIRIMTIENNQIIVRRQFNAPDNGTLKTAIPFSYAQKKKDGLLLHNISDSTLTLLSTDDNAVFTPIETIPLHDIAIQRIFVSDLNNDDIDEICLQGKKKFAIISSKSIQGYNSIQTDCSYETTIKDGKYVYLKLADINGDSVPEAVVIEKEHNIIQILNLGKKEITPLITFKTFESGPHNPNPYDKAETSVEPHEITFLDANGDSITDMAIIIHDRIILYLQEGHKKTVQ